MTSWLYPANVKFYDVLGAFAAPETYWPMNSKVEVDDLVYIYLAMPHKQIGFLCKIEQVDFEQDEIIDQIKPYFKGDGKDGKSGKKFMRLKTIKSFELKENSFTAYSLLKENGLAGMLMGPRKLDNNPALLHYIEEVTK
ncbi:MAG: hypothetical protein COB13_009660 [OCS116 cluster bacterium]|nr:hypothetical protein [OCS116 cluster bacterium]